jgi:hypothetical protein
MKLQNMSSDELKRELFLRPNNDAVWHILKRTIVNEAIIATINIDGTNDKGTSNSLSFGLYGIVRLRANGEIEPPKPTNNDGSQEAS